MTHPINDREVFIPPTTESGGLPTSARALMATEHGLTSESASFIMPVAPDVVTSMCYLPSEEPEFFTLSDFLVEMEDQCRGEENDTWLHLLGNSVPEAADGLVKAIKSVNRSHLELFDARSIIRPAGLSLGKMFSVPHWMFRA